ncbi:SDR family oxidoreductase [Hydrogenophaga taeniospiralis]|uniref:SDR family oxidoreductase n=1 Tax=Hydrogenophaga taeniospiralis TaxID=65656 RepID=UPI001CFC3337|nr:SDR family oxidoreductase [Hydrogenophaga taeniospiralis]MCB4364796.1 SDR family oxidoreductase [Hydrogenophaga taeniospiralis]
MNKAPQSVIVTGAAGNLGQAVAHAFGVRGYRLALFDLNAEALRSVYGPDSADQLCVPLNLLDKLQVEAAVQQVAGQFGGVDVLCHLAGGFRMGEAVHATSAQTLDFLLDINLRALLPISAAVVPRMVAAGGGRIVTVGAMGAQRGGAQMGAYAASKSALMRMTESMSAELKGKGINVNCVLPSIIDTPENRAAMPAADPTQWVTPQALADVMVFLASDAARAVHGASIPVTGLV